MSERSNTKQEILKTALDLFSVQGYEATSISQIAEAVGIRKASLYSHFGCKQDILDALVSVVLTQYNKHSIFANAKWEDYEYNKDFLNITLEESIRMILGQVCYIIHDPTILKSRKMLTIEQFQNQELSWLLTKQNYTDVLNYFSGFVSFLIAQGKLRDDDAQIMAAQLCLPITVWINLCDREPNNEDVIMVLIERHIRRFFKIYGVTEEE